MKYIFTDKAPTPGSYSQAVCVDPRTHVLVFLAGQTGNIPGVDGEPVIDGGVGPQTTQALKNILAVVEAAGGNVDSIVKLEVVLKDSNALSGPVELGRAHARNAMNTAYVEFFTQHGRTKEKENLPARTMMWVSEVPLEYPNEDTQVEITATAAIPQHWKAADV